MNEESLINLITSDRSSTSKYSLIGNAIKRGDLDWVLDAVSDGETIHEKIYIRYIAKIKHRPVCKFCSSPVPFTGFTRGFKLFCNSSHAGKYLQLEHGDSIRKKSKRTLMENYGVSNPFKIPSSIENQKKAMALKRGSILSEDHKASIKKGMVNKYGVENPSQAEIIRDKITSTMIGKYGGYYIGSEEGVRARKESWIANRLTKLEIIDKISLLEDYVDSKREYKACCLECNLEFLTSIANGFVRKCPRCHFIPANRSKKEAELSEIVERMGEVVLTNVKNKNLIYPLSLDIWIPEKNIAIEFNGDYYHCDKFKDKNYHLKKLKECEAKGIKLIQIFEHEYDVKRDLIVGRLKSILNKNEKTIGARRLSLTKLKPVEERLFFEQNHIQGYVPSSHCFALVRGSEVLAAMSFGRPRFDKKSKVELLRFASKSGYTIPGAGSKLLNNAKHLWEGGTLISYCDRRWSDGEFYKRVGFSLARISSPSYIYVHARTKQIVSRYSAQKHRLKSLLGDNYDESLTEGENMEMNKFFKLWDCGQMVYVLRT